MTAQPVFDLAEPFVELFGAAAIHRRERADHAVAAGGDHEFDAGDEKHRRRDQRQAEAIAKARRGSVVARCIRPGLSRGLVVLALAKHWHDREGR